VPAKVGIRHGPPAYDDATAAEIRELVAKGAAGGGMIFEIDDCRGTYERLRAAGATLTTLGLLVGDQHRAGRVCGNSGGNAA